MSDGGEGRVDREAVRHVAELARLRLDPHEEERVLRELGEILEYVEQVREAAMGEPVRTGEDDRATEGATDGPPGAEDVAGSCLEHDTFLAHAPRSREGLLAVPAVRRGADRRGAERAGSPGAEAVDGERPAGPDARGTEREPGSEEGGEILPAEGLAARGALELAAAVRRGEASAEEVVEAHLERLEEVEPRVGAFLERAGEAARERAREIDREIAAGGDPGPLAGVPVAVKDNLALEGAPLTCASRILAAYTAPYTATAVERLLDAGAVVVGKTNLDEFAMGSSTESSAFHPTRNPRSLDRVPGGSSGGSAAAVAAQGVPLALGSDTGGSIRQPAAFCGCVGVKPTWGRVSRHGLVAFASSLDTVGPLARTVVDAATTLALVAGADPRDSTCADRPVPDLAAEARRGADAVRGTRVGVPREVAGIVEPEAVAGWEAALERLGTMGCEVVELSVPALSAAVAAYHLVATAEASSNLARFDGVRYGHRVQPPGGDLDALYRESRSAGFGLEVKRRILLGTFALSAGYHAAHYGHARELARRLRRELEAALEEADVLATPTAPGGAFPLGAMRRDPLALYRWDSFTAPVNLAGLPAVAVPSGRDEAGLPLSLQVIGGPYGEGAALGVALAFERATGFA